MKGIVVMLLMVLVAVSGVAAECTVIQSFGVAVSMGNTSYYPVTQSLTAFDNCTGSASVQWIGQVNLTFGDVLPGEVVVTRDSVFVDSVARPDLDSPAIVRFTNVVFAITPNIYRDGVQCNATVGCTNISYDANSGVYTVVVDGFSNYTLQGSRDFTVYSDQQPELSAKVYQTVDLGDSYRADEFKCVVQVYGRSPTEGLVLIQTNPERGVPARLFGSPDPNNPESLGYFRTENGLANVYYDGSKLQGYQELEYVVQCASNFSKLVYEEPISTRYRPAGRALMGRGLWLTDGQNAFFFVIGVVIFVLALWVLLKFVRSLR